MKMSDSILRDQVVFFCLLTLIVVRIVITSVTWMGIVSYIGLVIAIWDFYKDIEDEFIFYAKFYTVRGVFILLFIVLMILGILMIISIISIDDRIVDVLTLLTLLISLPKKFLCSIIAAYIIGGKING